MSRIVEINVIKMELDERTSTVTQIDTFKIGSQVNVLVKDGYNEGKKVYPGVIVDFNSFKSQPTITVAYLGGSYSPELKMAFVHEGSDVEIVASASEIPYIEQASVVDHFNREIAKKENEANDLRAKLKFFNERFGAYFGATNQ